MNNDVKTKNDKEIAYFFHAGDRMIKGIDALRKKNRPLLNGHRYLTDDCISIDARCKTIATWEGFPLSS